MNIYMHVQKAHEWEQWELILKLLWIHLHSCLDLKPNAEGAPGPVYPPCSQLGVSHAGGE